jgi:regulator of sigma E protease
VGRSGIKTKDRILSMNHQSIVTWEALERQYERMAEQTQGQLRYMRTSEGTEVDWAFTKPKNSKGLGFDFGLFSSELFVEKVIAESPAQKAGLQVGDRLLGIGDQDVQSFFSLKDAVQNSGEKEGFVRLRWERAGKLYAVQVAPTATQGRDPVLNKITSYTVGVVPMLVLAEPVTYIERVFNPFKLVYRATERVIVFSWRNLVSLKKLATGEVSSGSLGGPIMIGKIAGESLSRGVVAFLMHMAIFSVGLGILNVLPIPVLDGGHLLLLSIEVVRGKPLSLRQTEIVQGIGLILILTLMGIAFRNDITRLVY